ncbi:hypothetical protein B5F76_10585 [Desulfovibrio sp. An276]|nr:hypothetical protein B5F76_10585 [Desulfovibrio sp. An276]
MPVRREEAFRAGLRRRFAQKKLDSAWQSSENVTFIASDRCMFRLPAAFPQEQPRLSHRHFPKATYGAPDCAGSPVAFFCEALPRGFSHTG